MGGGEAAQDKAAEAVSGEVQRGVGMPSEKGARGFGQRGGVVRVRLPDAVIAEGFHGQILPFEQAGEGQHRPGVHVDAVQEENVSAHGVCLSGCGCGERVRCSGDRQGGS